MNLLIAAQSGHGKSWLAQQKIEQNLDADIVFVADYDDEYRGLVESHPDVKWHPVGPIEARYSPSTWAQILRSNRKIVAPRYRLDDEAWRNAIASIAKAMRLLKERNANLRILMAIDEAHSVAPQSTKFPKEITNLAVDGRGELISVIWITQRMAMIDKDIVSQCNTRFLGGFTDPNDLNSISVDYPVDIHNPTMERVPNLTDELTVEGKSIPVRQFRDDSGDLIGSEWIYSDTAGNRRRVDTRHLDMKSVHYGAQGYDLRL